MLNINRFLTTTIFCIGLGIILTTSLQAQNRPDTTNASLEELLRTNSYPLEFENGKLGGQGHAWLRKKAAEATIVTFGETHASREIPVFISAIISDMQQANEFDYLAIEVSPWTARQMTDRLQKGKQTYNQFIRKYPSAIPFYNFKNERDLLYQFVQKSEKTQPLWGLDQLFSFASSLALDRLETLAPTDNIRSAIQKIRASGSSKIADDPRLKNLPNGLPAPISVYNIATFDTLRPHFEGIAEAQQILDELVKSIEIYRLNDQNNYASNQLRARYLRKNLREPFRAARQKGEESPRVIIKIGGWHAYRGLTPNNALDVGNLAVSLARSVNGKALNVAVLCGPGSKNLSFPADTSNCWPSYLGEELEALSENQPVLFDLTKLHPKLHEAELEISDQLEAFLWGFDAVVIIPNTHPAEPIAKPGN